MSYTKTNWHDGDTITAVKMNKIENGIESSLSDALVTLGKALCGDSFEVKPGLTDAETILEIAKNYKAPEGGGGSETFLPVITVDYNDDFGNNIVTSHTFDELVELFTPDYSTGIWNGTATIKFVSDEEGPNGRIWACSDVDYDNNDKPVVLYLGTGDLASKPSVDREGGYDAYRTYELKISSETTDELGHPMAVLNGGNGWERISS